MWAFIYAFSTYQLIQSQMLQAYVIGIIPAFLIIVKIISFKINIPVYAAYRSCRTGVSALHAFSTV